MKKFLISFAAFLGLTFLASATVEAGALTHPVQNGESLTTISDRYGIPIAAIKRMNGLSSNEIHAGTSLAIPAAVSAEERELLAKLVHAEAKGESYAGKVAAATVVLNRVDSDEFPNTVSDVIYEVTPSGHYAFSPVLDGAINQEAGTESRKAVTEALAFRGQGNHSLFFYNAATATSDWVATREQTIVIDNHIFAK
ncbi:cell wall hydrolase [Shouchella shacheensis]|uniref:cell wall hydrolase n=1 Tax=Shouchella shacheensis TaxID=1649580 RepID=UPI00073FDCA0|nr:cell wall hydrolase [Shouchella shacheensis]